MPVTDAIDSFLPVCYSSALRSQVYGTYLHYQFQDFTYDIDSSLTSITFAFASTDYDEVVGIDSVTITGDRAVIPVTIDIKPGSDPNSINLGSKGVVPVAILTTADFDASTVDPTTVKFADASPVKRNMEDVDGDGDMDMILHFKTQDLNLDEYSTEATLTGKTDDGIDFEGTDSVNIVPKKGKK